MDVQWSARKHAETPLAEKGSHAGGPHLGVTGRLLVLVLLPLVVLTSVSAPLALQARVDAQRAQTGKGEVPALTATIRALDAVAVEQGRRNRFFTPWGAGSPSPWSNTMLGSNVEAELRSAEPATDRAIDVAAAGAGPGLLLQLEPARAVMEAGQAVPPESIDSRYEQVESPWRPRRRRRWRRSSRRCC